MILKRTIEFRAFQCRHSAVITPILGFSFYRYGSHRPLVTIRNRACLHRDSGGQAQGLLKARTIFRRLSPVQGIINGKRIVYRPQVHCKRVR